MGTMTLQMTTKTCYLKDTKLLVIELTVDVTK